MPCLRSRQALAMVKQLVHLILSYYSYTMLSWATVCIRIYIVYDLSISSSINYSITVSPRYSIYRPTTCIAQFPITNIERPVLSFFTTYICAPPPKINTSR